jgi:hypothetical protein
MSYYDIGKIRELSVDRGLFDVSETYRKWVKALIETPFASDLKDIQEKLKKIEDFWTKGKVSAFYNFSDFVRERKDVGVVFFPRLRSCVLSGLLDDSIWDDALIEEAERIRKVMHSVAGLKEYTIHIGEATNFLVDKSEYPSITLTMVKRKEDNK